MTATAQPGSNRKLQQLNDKPCPGPEVEFCLRENYRFRAELGLHTYFLFIELNFHKQYLYLHLT